MVLSIHQRVHFPVQRCIKCTKKDALGDGQGVCAWVLQAHGPRTTFSSWLCPKTTASLAVGRGSTALLISCCSVVPQQTSSHFAKRHSAF